MARRRDPSENFYKIMAAIPKAVAAQLDANIEAEAEAMVRLMKASANEGPTGNLKKSIRKERTQGRPFSWTIRAGGPLTTKSIRKSISLSGRIRAAAAGKSLTYDYAHANEFGTVEMKAQPFFWPSYRLRKKPAVNGVIRKAKKAIGQVVKLG